MLVFWHSALASINEVNQRRARLVLRWVTVSRFNFWRVTSIPVCNQPPSQLSLAIPSWVGAMSTSQRAVMSCRWEYRQGMVRVWMAGETV